MTRFIHKMILRAEIAQAIRYVIAACLLTAFAGVAEAQLQKPRTFSRADYETYFEPAALRRIPRFIKAMA
jgi:hypothetical protein